MASLPPFLRTLLVTDGTVTRSLEAFFWEPVTVDQIFHELVSAEAPIPWLGVEQGERVIARQVMLRGTVTRTTYAVASSVIRPGSIPHPVRERLAAGSLGIGELIRDCGLETYRELLEVGPSSAAAPNEPDSEVYRTYRITLGGNPAILVAEFFSVSTYAQR